MSSSAFEDGVDFTAFSDETPFGLEFNGTAGEFKSLESDSSFSNSIQDFESGSSGFSTPNDTDFFSFPAEHTKFASFAHQNRKVMSPVYSPNMCLSVTQQCQIQRKPKTMKRVPADLSTGEVFKQKQRKSLVEKWISSTPISARTDALFYDFLTNTHATINPSSLGFIPSYFWPNKEIPFGDIVSDYFQRKNNTNCRFIHKLYDALLISQQSEVYQQLVGVKWVTPFVLLVNKGQFARLLGIKSIDGSLFHQQGNFSTHGFIEIDAEKAAIYCQGVDISVVDFDEVRLLIHQQGLFVQGVQEMSLLNCKWVNEHKKK